MKGMDLFNKWVARAKEGSRGALAKLNWGLSRMIPFNKPHRLKVAEIGEDFVRIYAPYRRSNLNHIKGIHACAIATISEFATGFLLLTRVDPKQYRLIMAEINVKYHYQAKRDIYAFAQLNNQEIEEKIIRPLETEPQIMLAVPVEVKDTADNLIATAMVHWQLKSWKKVKTKVE